VACGREAALRGRLTERRLRALEERAGKGRIAVVGAGRWDWTKEDLDRAAAEARERIGPGGTVICVKYVEDWHAKTDTEGA
jgi:hypothetical protein